jgi:hypothetical protein
MPFEIMDLPDENLDHINETKGYCPNCDGELAGGPCGGSSQNFRCIGCGQEYNLGLNRHGNPFVWMGEKLQRKEPALYTDKYLSDRWLQV